MTRILIADDHAVVRSGLKLIVGSQPDLDVVGEASTGAEALALALSLNPDILLLDIAMPELNGLDAARLIREQAPAVRIIVLTMYDDEAYLRQFLEAGVAGYVLKQAAETELLAAIRAVESGGAFIDPSLTGRLFDLYLEKSQRPQPSSRTGSGEPELSAREREVLRLIALGHSGQQIAQKLVISTSTVETHRAHIMEKLGLRGRAQLVRYALSAGLLQEADN